MLRRLYGWMMGLAASRLAPVWLALLAFCEGVFFPIPPDVILAPMVLARRDRGFAYAGLCLIASVCGGCVGYSVGYFLRPVGLWLLSLTGHAASANDFQNWYGQWGVLMLAVPIPYKLTAIASGLFKLDLVAFVVASLFIRGLRFFLEAILLRIYGPPIQAFIERHLALVVSVVALAAIGLVLAIGLLR